MRVRVTQSIRIDAESYEAIGKLLDRIDGHTQTAFAELGMEGKHDFTGFDTQPCKAAVFDGPPQLAPQLSEGAF